mgnify:CR=1 FL=1
MEGWWTEHGEHAVPFIAVASSGEVTVASQGKTLNPKSGDTLIGLTGVPVSELATRS